MAISQSTTIQAYQLRKGGTPARLAILRMIAADSVNNRNESTRLQPGDWKGARHYTMGGYAGAYCYGIHPGQGQWYSHAGENFRNERDSHEMLRALKHTGWYTDTDGQESAVGIVAGLSHGRFIAGYRWTATDERVYFPQVFDDETDAARMADEHAREFAESAREDDECFNAMALAEIDVEEKTRAVGEAFALRHRLKFGGPERVREAIESLWEARETLADATREYERG